MFYKTLRYRLARPLTVTRLRYNFILLSKLISEKAYYVKDNVVLQGLCPSSNCLYTNLLKSTMLRPLKGEVGYKLAASKWSKTPAQAPLAFNCRIDLMFFFKVYRFLHPSMANNVIACRCSSVIYPIYRFHHLKMVPGQTRTTFHIQHHTTLMFYEMLHSFGHLVVSCCIMLYLVV